MSIIDNMIERNKRILMINLTNQETMAILKNERISEYYFKLQECHQRYSEDETRFFECIISNICPEQTESFVKCQNENLKDINKCAPILLHLDECMKENNKRTINMLSKLKNY